MQVWKRRKSELVPAAPMAPLTSVATAQDTAERLVTLTVAERELWEWGRQQKPMTIGCIRGSHVVGVDHYLSLFGIQQHIEQCLELADDSADDILPLSCTHVGAGAAFPSRLNALLAGRPVPGGGRWTAAALARAITGQGVAVHPAHLIALSDGRRAASGSAVVAAIARVLNVPVSYFGGRAVRLSTDPATGQQTITEELYDPAGDPNPYPAAVLKS